MIENKMEVIIRSPEVNKGQNILLARLLLNLMAKFFTERQLSSKSFQGHQRSLQGHGWTS